MTAVLEEDATLTRVDDAMKKALEDAADAYKQAPARLRDEIIAAARAGQKPAAIVRVIRYVYTYDYVARLVREDRRENPGLYAKP